MGKDQRALLGRVSDDTFCHDAKNTHERPINSNISNHVYLGWELKIALIGFYFEEPTVSLASS